MALSGFSIRYALLGILIIQNTVTILCIRLSRVSSASSKKLMEIDGVQEPRGYIMSTLVLTTEIFKISIVFICLALFHSNSSIPSTIRLIHKEVVCKPKDTIMVAVPGIVYVVQDNLVIFALSCLDAATYQVTYQARILTTALFAMFLLKKSLNMKHWVSLILLTCGVILAQFKVNVSHTTLHHDGSTYFFGLLAVGCATLTSGFAGIYNEKLLKDGRQPILLIRSFQLGIFTVLFAMSGVYIKDGPVVRTYGFFHGYSTFTFFLALLQAAGGLLVAATMKFADNILKTFATSISIIFSCLFSYFFLGDLNMSLPFVVGTIAIVLASYLYGQASASSKQLVEANVDSLEKLKLKAQ